MDIADLYDHEIAKVKDLSTRMYQRYSHKSNTYANLSDMAKWAEDELYKIGLKGYLDISPVLLGRPPILEIQDRVEGAYEHTEGLDHERKRFEVLDANVKGEKFRGEKEKAN